MGSTRDSFARPAAGEGCAPPATPRASDSPSNLGQGADPSVPQRVVKAGAAKVFDKLDADKDGTLDLKELHGRLSRKEFAAADPDHDKTLSRDEYLALVEQRFKAADTDHEGTLSNSEFHTPKGRALARLLR